MPIYEFKCDSCDTVFDKLCRSSSVESTHCKNCGKPCPRQMSAPAAPKFKGSGFYETDFKHKK